MNTSIKRLIMTLVAFIAATLSDQLSTGAINWLYVGIASIGILLTYLGKDAAMPSISIASSVDGRDMLSGLFVALGAAVSSFAASMVSIGHADWKALGIACLTTFLGYIAKTYKSDPTFTKK